MEDDDIAPNTYSWSSCASTTIFLCWNIVATGMTFCPCRLDQLYDFSAISLISSSSILHHIPYTTYYSMRRALNRYRGIGREYKLLKFHCDHYCEEMSKVVNSTNAQIKWRTALQNQISIMLFSEPSHIPCTPSGFFYSMCAPRRYSERFYGEISHGFLLKS